MSTLSRQTTTRRPRLLEVQRPLAAAPAYPPDDPRSKFTPEQLHALHLVYEIILSHAKPADTAGAAGQAGDA